VLFVRPNAQDLQLMCLVLSMFEGTSSLGCNLHKWQLTLIRCNESQIQLALSSFPCQLAEFLVKYLGIPLSMHKLPKTVLQPLAGHGADRLQVWKGNLMNHSGWLALVKSTLSTIFVHTAIALRVLPWHRRAMKKT
jgi:hypothetical protein